MGSTSTGLARGGRCPGDGSAAGRSSLVGLNCTSPTERQVSPNLAHWPGPGRQKGGKMRTKLLLLVATLTAGVFAATASASGPGAPGKEPVEVTCDGLGTITVLVQRGENANGAAQILDMKGHGIPVDATLTLTDLTTSTVLGTETTATGHGNGHPNQPATHCTGVLFQGLASDFFGLDLPDGVAPTDTVQLFFDGFAVIKL